jgi:hypothetical protein
MLYRCNMKICRLCCFIYPVSLPDTVTQVHAHLRAIIVHKSVYLTLRDITCLTSCIFKITLLDCVNRLKHPFRFPPKQHTSHDGTTVIWVCSINLFSRSVLTLSDRTLCGSTAKDLSTETGDPNCPFRQMLAECLKIRHD